MVSGMRPTGRLHIGHYFGALENWVRLQNDPGYECFYFIADWHALTSDYADTSGVAQNTIEIMTDYLAAGLDPAKSVIFQQSLVPEHAELHLLVSMVTPLSWLERVPTYKEALEQVKDKDLHNYGFLGYPCLQTADIVIYSEDGVQLYVPVGEDQVSHVELSREIVRRFNGFYYEFEVRQDLFAFDNWPHLEFVLKAIAPIESKGQIEPSPPRSATQAEIAGHRARIRTVVRDIGIRNFLELMGERRRFFIYRAFLSEPDAMLTKTPRIPGLDGRKMSKSYGNAITLSEPDEEIRKKTKVMVTDPARKRRTDPGNPDVCPVFDWHKLFSAGEPGRLEWVRNGCTTAGIGCIECKSAMAENLIKWIAPVRERRVEYEERPGRVLEMIDEGSKRARVEAKRTMERVREAVFGWGKKKQEVLVTEKK
ncbi:MAG TPA: tryptophan--tRNA ligase [Verrucomicrobiae bacterium]|nr:tryptophan--tRNA ligase [Verrucomicrobiae bacterium]